MGNLRAHMGAIGCIVLTQTACLSISAAKVITVETSQHGLIQGK